MFGFTKLVVNDLEKSADFYKAVVGLTEQQRVEEDIAGRKISEIIFEPPFQGAATFVLLKFADRVAPVNEEVILGFITGSADDFITQAVANGGKLLQAAKDMPTYGVRVGFVTDNEGHMIEVVELLPPPD